MNFDFTIDDEPLAPPEDAKNTGPNLRDLSKMSTKKMAQSILNVYQALGGEAWLLTQAVADPRSFIDLLKKILPSNIKLDGMDELLVHMVDKFGASIEQPLDVDVADKAEQIGTMH